MKGKITKILVITIILVASIFQLTVSATSGNIISVRTEENQTLIYIPEVLNQEFEFAFSTQATPTNLNYIASIEDEQGNHIAYVNEVAKNTFFSENNSAYLWVKQGEKIIKEGTLVNLDLSKTEADLRSFENFTQKITVNSEADAEKITINGDENTKYYYQIYSVGSSEEYQRFVQVIEEMSKYTNDTNIYTKLETYQELENLYNNLAPKVDNENWVEAQNLEIEKPYDAKENQKYILWLKDDAGTMDFQVLTAYQKEIVTTEQKEVQVEVVSKLPITYDSTITLWIALAVVLVAIIIMLVIRKKVSNKDARK